MGMGVSTRILFTQKSVIKSQSLLYRWESSLFYWDNSQRSELELTTNL